MSAAVTPPAPVQAGVSVSQLRAMTSNQAEVAPQQQTKSPHSSNNKNTSKVTHLKKGNAITREDCFHFAHRLGIFAAALFYVISCLQSVPDTVRLLRGQDNPVVEHAPEDSPVMRKFIGSTTIRQSPLVLTALGGSTSPVPGTIYLNSTGGYTFSPCAAVTQQHQAIQIMYGDIHLRTLYQWTAASAAYNLTFLDPANSELIAPVVDCTISAISQADTTFLRASYLVRRVQNPDDVYMVSLKMANMEYTLPDQNEGGPVSVATLAYVNDLTSTTPVARHMLVSIGFPFEQLDFRVYEFKGVTTTGNWALRTIPKDPSRELAKNLFASARSGCYVKSESEQSNVNNELWVLESKPADTLAQIRFSTVAVVRDSWAWVHLVELWLGFDVLLNLFILVVVSAHNLAKGTLWMGDSFVAVSSTLLFRGALVVLSWYVDKFWSVTEFCTCDASAVTNLQSISIYASITHADLLSLYLSLSGVLGMLFRERVDPLFAVVCFEIGYGYRREFLKGIPSLLNPVSAYAHAIYTSSTQAATAGQENITPMQFRTTFETTGSASVNFKVLAAVLSSFGVIVLYIVVNKVYARVIPERLLILRSKNTSSHTHKSENEEALLAQKRQYTLFEVATGAQLENRFGLMSHYITCVFFKGTKFASADGIYSNGFVIANSKFLVQARDLFWIVLMKLAQARFTNVYVYELKGSSVQQKARLVYPETLTWKDLLLINITILS